MTITLDKNLYTKQALIKASYNFTDNFYVYLNQNENNYYVEINSKNGKNEELIKNDFENEILAQTARELIYNKTNKLRTLILARAFASTIIEEGIKSDISDDVNTHNNLFEDWFKENE